MSSPSDRQACDRVELVFAYAIHALPQAEVAPVEEHISVCSECRQELETLRPVVDSLVAWPTDVLRPSPSCFGRLAQRIADETGEEPLVPEVRQWSEPEWDEVAPGLWCKLLATESERVSMLVRLEPGAAYPPHIHTAVEELHLLDGELWIDDRKLHAGDYNRAEPGTADRRVWTETGCTCVLITSPDDVFPS